MRQIRWLPHISRARFQKLHWLQPVVSLLLLALVVLAPYEPSGLPAQAAPQSLPPLQASCYKTDLGLCKLTLQPFSLSIAADQRLLAFKLQANNKVLYDFRTDANYGSLGSYTPSSVAVDFAAQCGQIYTLNLLAQTSGGSSYYLAGQTSPITCPAGSYPVYLPQLGRKNK